MFSSQMGSPPELLEEFLRPGSQEFLLISNESVENLLLEMEFLLKDPLELTESLLEDDTESLLLDDRESRLKDPTDEANESRRRVEPNAAIGLMSFFKVPSLRTKHPVDNPMESLLKVAGKEDGWASDLIGEPSTMESLLNRLAVGNVFKAGMESLLEGNVRSFLKLIDSLRLPGDCKVCPWLMLRAGMLSRRGPTLFFRMLSRRGGGGAKDPLRSEENPPWTSHFLSTVWVTTDTLLGSGAM